MTLLITQAEIEDLPDDPRQRFVSVEQICRRRYEELIREQEEWSYVKDCRLRYMSSVLSAAKYLKIEPVCDLELPRRKNFDDNEYEDFVLQIEFFSMQLMLEGAERNSQISVVIEGAPRDRVLTLVSHLRDHIGRMDIPASRRTALISRLDEFEKELNRPRLRFVTVAAMVLFVAGATADLGGATDVVRKLVSEIEEIIGAAKIEQDLLTIGSRPLSVSEIKLIAPRSDDKNLNGIYDLDDDIPF